MVYRPASRFLIRALLLAGAAASAGYGQISFPGQSPGQYPGQYPGQGRNPQGGSASPFPGRGRTTKTQQQDNQVPTIAINGVLRRISASDLVVEADDKRIVTLTTGTATKYYKKGGATGKTDDFLPGDHVNVDATQDDNGYYHAKTVTQIKLGTADEQAAAAQPPDSSPIADGGKPDGDDDRPRLHRAGSASDPAPDNSSSRENTPRAQITRGDSDTSQPVARNESQAPEAPAPPDPTDSGPPTLRRGIPQRRSAPADPEPSIAENNPPRPSIHADEVNGVTRTPQPPKAETLATLERPSAPQKSDDPAIEKAREAAYSFSETLPNYMVKQFTTRYQTEASRGGQTSWHAIDNVTADVVSDGGKETYKNILINGKAPKEAVEKTGSWSTGEFAGVLLDIFAPETDADFHNRRSTTIVNRAAFRYDFSVAQENSHWHVYSSAESYKPEYTGAVWIDKENSRVLRIELIARNVPKAFPLDTVESAVDYDYVLIGERKFLLPVHSEALSCTRGTSVCSRNVIDFRNYKKFGADTSVTFDATPDK